MVWELIKSQMNSKSTAKNVSKKINQTIIYNISYSEYNVIGIEFQWKSLENKQNKSRISLNIL